MLRYRDVGSIDSSRNGHWLGAAALKITEAWRRTLISFSSSFSRSHAIFNRRFR